jgi:hypothetical protein
MSARLRFRAAATVCLVGLVLGLLGSLGTTASADQRRDWSTTVPLASGHVDPAPPGVDVKRKLRTDEMLARAAARREQKLRARPDRLPGRGAPAGDPSLSTASATGLVPAGVSALSSLTSHVAPACSGTGSDGNRVQVLYVVEADDPNRFASVLPILRDEVANVDDTFAVSAAKDGGGLRVRWVFDPATCQPVITPVTVRAGELASFATMLTAVQRMGYTATDRKYLMFADAAVLCGIGHLILDDRPTGNANDGGNAMYARVDTGCWQASSSGSIAAHELMHNLGGIQGSAGHSTPYGHCDDDNDLMCYADGSGVPMRQVCPKASEPLFDCGGDDYFATDPAPDSYLATRWNTARSSFLETVAPLPLGDPVPDDPTPLTLTLSASSRYVGQRLVLTTRLGSASAPVQGWVQLWASTDGQTWTPIGGAADTGSDGVYAKAVWPRRSTSYRAAVTAPADAGWVAPADAVASVRVTRWPVHLVAKATAGRPDVVTGRLTSATSGRGLAGRRLVLQRKFAGATTWRSVDSDVTGSRGYVKERVQPRRGTYFRWVFAGSSAIAAGTSPRVYVRY